jgi:hypothetical protein
LIGIHLPISVGSQRPLINDSMRIISSDKV